MRTSLRVLWIRLGEVNSVSYWRPRPSVFIDRLATTHAVGRLVHRTGCRIPPRLARARTPSKRTGERLRGLADPAGSRAFPAAHHHPEQGRPFRRPPSSGAPAAGVRTVRGRGRGAAGLALSGGALGGGRAVGFWSAVTGDARALLHDRGSPGLGFRFFRIDAISIE